jgi:uncharacterized protein (DUF885 family)
MASNRRQFITAGSVALLASGIPPDSAQAGSASAADEPAAKLLTQFGEDLLADYPENATALGVDTGSRAALKARLTDRTAAGQARIARRAAERRAALEALDAAALGEQLRTDVDVLRTAYGFAGEGFRFPYGDVALLNLNWSWRNAPYVVAQNTGAFLEIPSLLTEQHTIATREDADAYLSRLEAYAGQLEGETERLARDASQGVIAPDFLLDKTISQLTLAQSGEVDAWPIVASLATRAKALGGQYARDARAIAKDRIAPALARQLHELAAQRRKATGDAGVWKLPRGEEYYAWCLVAGTTTRLTPTEIHQRGMDELRELQSRMDVILRSRGMTQGSVGERMTALGKDPRYQYADTDADRARLMALLHASADRIRPALPRAFATLVRGNLEIKRMAPEVEPGAPGAYGGAGTIDGKVPGKFWINMHDMGVWRSYSMPTLVYHESIPGHVWQGEYTFDLPLYRSLLAFNAYSEGWALYAEQLADELGMYADDPLAQLGYLQSIAFRACRLVVDTGLHAQRWTREQAIRWFADTNGSSLAEVTGEVDRYCAWPGQACGYKIGHSEINRLRAETREALGARYDLKRFDDIVVKAGGVPMVTLARIVQAQR